jgi:serine/threonine protein kinase
MNAEGSSDDRDPLERLAEEFVARHRRGEHPSPEEYAERHPLWAGQIRQMFPALLLMERHKPGTGERSGPDSAAPLPAGPPLERLGDYRIVREVGRGGMGVVYEAVQESLGRPVALKVLPGPIDVRQRKRFALEARAAACLHHTNIVPVFGVGHDAGVDYYAMQFIPGQGLDAVLDELRRLRDDPARGGAATADGAPAEVMPTAADLADELRSGGRGEPTAPGGAPPPGHGVTPADGSAGSSALGEPTEARYFRAVARVGEQVAGALAYAHAEGVLHRDVKPSNVLLDHRGTAWVADFGLAKLEGSEGPTRTGDVVGTLRYMAPERFEGRSDPRGDVYGLGATLYEMLTLRPAFDEPTRARLVERILRDDPPRPRVVDRRVPRGLETVVLKCLEKDPGRRYQTAGELAEDLRRFLEDRPVKARRASAAEQAWRWCRRNPAVASLAATVALLFFGGFSLVSWKWLEAESQKALLRRAQLDVIRERNEAKDSAATAEAINHFLVDEILKAAAPERTGGRPVTIQEVLLLAAEKVGPSFSREPMVEASVRLMIGEIYFQSARYPEARPHLTRAHELYDRLLGPGHPDTLKTLNSLGLLEMQEGHLPEAERLLRLAWGGLSAALGPEDHATLECLSHLAVLLRRRGKLAEAEPLSRRALEGMRRVLGPEHHDTLSAGGNLALLLADLDKVGEAESLYRENLETARRVLGPEHPHTLTVMNSLAALLTRLGRLGEAEPLQREALETERRVLGPDHTNTLNAANNLGNLLRKQGRPAEAESLHRTVLDARSKKFQPGHPSILTAMGNLALDLDDLGRPEEAGALHRQVLEARRAVLGPDHRSTQNAAYSLAEHLYKRGKPDDAEPLLRELLATQRRILPKDHPSVADTLQRLGEALATSHRAGDAEPLLVEALAIRRRNASRVDVGEAESLLGGCLTTLGRHAEAEPLLLAGYEKLVASSDTGLRRVERASARLIDLYDASGRPEEAARWRATAGPVGAATPEGARAP